MSLGFHSLGVLAAPGRAVCVNSGRPKPTGKESGGKWSVLFDKFFYLSCFVLGLFYLLAAGQAEGHATQVRIFPTEKE